MGFRDKREADRRRIDVLEDELEDKDAEIARLSRELAEQRAAKSAEGARKRAAKAQAKRAAGVPRVRDLPEGDVWELETTHPPGTWKVGVLWMVVLFGLLGAFALTREDSSHSLWLVAAIFGLPGLMLFHRTGLIVDRKQQQVTRWDSVLLRIKRRWPVGDRSIRVEVSLRTPKSGDSWWAGTAYLGDRKLFMMKRPDAEDLAKRLAAYLKIPFVD